MLKSNLMQALTKDEQRKIIGGKADTYNCTSTLPGWQPYNWQCATPAGNGSDGCASSNPLGSGATTTCTKAIAPE